MASAAALVCQFVSWAQDLLGALEYNGTIAIRAPKLVVLGRPVVAYHTDEEQLSMLATSLELATKYDYLAEKFQKSFEWLKK